MADRYWIGGSGNWDASTTTHWSDSSGGAGGQSVPTSSDNVFFDTASSIAEAAYTVTITAAANCLNFTMDGPSATDATKVTWAGTFALNIYGSLNLSGGTAGITRTYTGIITFASTSTGKTINTNGVSMASRFDFNGVGGGWTLASNLVTTGDQIIVTKGSFNDGNYNIDFVVFNSSNTNVRGLTIGTGIWTSAGANGAAFNILTTTNLTFSCSSSNTIIISSSDTNNRLFAATNLTFGNFKFSGSNTEATDAFIIRGGPTFNNFTVEGNSKTIKFKESTTTTFNSFTALGTSGNHFIITSESTTNATLAKAGGGVISGCDYIDASYLTGSPVSTWYIGANSTEVVGSSLTNIYLLDPPSSIALTGTVTTANETDIVTGGKTIILTITGDTWVASGATFDAQRQAIINGITSAGSETNGWNNEVRDNEAVTAVVRTSDTVATITLSASASYNITANETITVTVPSTALTGASAIVASPTFTITSIASGNTTNFFF